MYKKMNIYKGEYGSIERAIITMDNGSFVTVSDRSQIIKHLQKFAAQLGLTTDQLLSSDKVLFLNNVESKAIIPANSKKIVEQRPDVNKKEEIIEKDTDKTKKKGGKVKKVTALVLGAAIFAGGVSYFISRRPKYEGQNMIVKQEYSTGQIPSYPGYEEAYVQGENLEASLLSIVRGNRLSEDELRDVMTNFSLIANSNMIAISEYLNGSELDNSEYICNFDGVFYENQSDLQVVNFFTTARNKIVAAAYQEHDKEATKKAIDEFCTLYISFVFNNQEYAVYNGKAARDRVKFNDLSDMAQNAILNLGAAVLNIRYNKNFTVDGCSKQQAYNDTLALYEQNMDNIINKSSRK